MEHFIDVDTGRLWSCVEGDPAGRAVLLLSGGPGCCDYLAPVSAMLKSEYRVIRFEQRGCGRSVRDGRYDLDTAVSDIERVREAYGLSRFTIGGHSWGANLALVYGLEHPESVDSLLYIAGSGIHNNRSWLEEFYANRDAIGEAVPEMDYAFNPEVNDRGNASLRLFGQRPDFYKRVSQLDAPTAFIMAENDIRPSWPVEQLYRLMPRAEYTRIPGAEHYIWLSNAKGLRDALLAFLRKTDF